MEEKKIRVATIYGGGGWGEKKLGYRAGMVENARS